MKLRTVYLCLDVSFVQIWQYKIQDQALTANAVILELHKLQSIYGLPFYGLEEGILQRLCVEDVFDDPDPANDRVITSAQPGTRRRL